MKTVRSYPFVVRFSQLGELNLSLGVSEPRNTSEAEALVTFTVFNLVL